MESGEYVLGLVVMYRAMWLAAHLGFSATIRLTSGGRRDKLFLAPDGPAKEGTP